MIESVFKELLKQNIVKDIQIMETLPSKGKPAKKASGSTTIWIVKFNLGDNQESILESARGGPREWASLDSLSNWLRACGVEKFQVNYLSDSDRLPQEAFEFVRAM